MRKKYVYIYKLQTWRYIRECIYTFMCVCVYITCIYAFLRGVREIDASDGELPFRFSCCAFLGKFYIVRSLLIPNDEILLSRSRNDEKRRGETSKQRSIQDRSRRRR